MKTSALVEAFLAFFPTFSSRTQIRAHGSNKTYILSNIYFEIICLLIRPNGKNSYEWNRNPNKLWYGLQFSSHKKKGDLRHFFGLFDQIFSFIYEADFFFLSMLRRNDQGKLLRGQIESIILWNQRILLNSRELLKIDCWISKEFNRVLLIKSLFWVDLCVEFVELCWFSSNWKEEFRKISINSLKTFQFPIKSFKSSIIHDFELSLVLI